MRRQRPEAIELAWLLRFYAARWRGRRSARIIRQQREAVMETYVFEGRHALHEASTP